MMKILLPVSDIRVQHEALYEKELSEDKRLADSLGSLSGLCRLYSLLVVETILNQEKLGLGLEIKLSRVKIAERDNLVYTISLVVCGTGLELDLGLRVWAGLTLGGQEKEGFGLPGNC
jgi:hypothetical protein